METRKAVISTDLTYMEVFVSRLYYKINRRYGDVRQLLIMEATGQLINNKASRFILCSMYVFFSIPYPK